MKLDRTTQERSCSAAIIPTLWLTTGCFALLALGALAADPAWWSNQGAVLPESFSTNNGVVTTNNVPNPSAVATQGQLKQFTAAAAAELTADLTNAGGAGPALSNLVYGWQQDYATNNYNSSTNLYRPYKPGDFEAVNVGQLKYIASLVYGQLYSAGYTGLYPSWIQQNTNTDNNAATLGELKEVFDFDLTLPPAAPTVVNVIENSDGSITFTWDPSTLATGYVIEESTNGGATWTAVEALPAPQTTTNPTFTSTVNYDGTTTDSYTLSASQTGSSGTLYSVNASNNAGTSSTSSGGALTPIVPIPVQNYAVIDLSGSVQGTNDIQAVKVGASGQVAFAYGYNTNTAYIALWNNGSITAPPTLTGAPWPTNYNAEYSSSSWGINSSGTLFTQMNANYIAGNLVGLWSFGSTAAPGNMGPAVENDVNMLAENGDLYGSFFGYPIVLRIDAGDNASTMRMANQTSGDDPVTTVSGTGAGIIFSPAAGGSLYTPVSGATWSPITNPIPTNTVSWTTLPNSVDTSVTAIDDANQAFYQDYPSPVQYYDGANAGSVNNLLASIYQRQVGIYEGGPLTTTGQAVLYGNNLVTATGTWTNATFITSTTNGASTSANGTWPLTVVHADTNWNVGAIAGLNTNGSMVATAAYVGTNTSIYSGNHAVELVPFEVTQSNYPVPSTADSSTDSGATTTTQVIVGAGAATGTNAGIALITGAPAMPQLTVKINGLDSSNLTVDWRAAITSERTERGTKDNFDIPFAPGEGNGGGPGIVDNEPIGTAWNMSDDYPESPQEFFGGNVTIYYRIKKADGTYLEPAEQTLTTFKIRGLNPLDATAKTYMQNPSNCEYSWAWAVAEHESRQTYGSTDYVYNEFNAQGSTAELPNFSGGYPDQDGWGIFQRDDTDGGIYVDTDQVYSWTVNTFVAMNELESKQTAQQRFFTAVATAYPNDPEAQSPPASYPAYTGSSTMMSALDMGTITLYNGVEGCPTTTLNGVTYQNPWTFNENGQSGHKWSYTQNANNYLYKVIYNEYEGHLPYSE